VIDPTAQQHPESAPTDLRDPPKGRFLFGHLMEFRSNPLETMAVWQRQYGDLVRFKLGPRAFYLLSHPGLAEEVLIHKPDVFDNVYQPNNPAGLALMLGNGLLTSTGEVWRKHRLIIQPIFHRGRMALMAQKMIAVTERLLDRWKQRDLDHPLDISSEMTQITLEIITQTMFSTSVLKEIDKLRSALEVLRSYAFNSMHYPLRMPQWVPTPANREYHRAKAFVDQLMYGLIAERKVSCERHDDLLDMLLHARDEGTGEGLSDEQLRDEMITIFSAGHETTANALSWTWYLLAKHPEVRVRLQDELTRVLNGRSPTVDDLPRLPYIQAVFEETLRLYPPAPAVQRRVTAATMLGSRELPGGSIVLVSIGNIHRHPDFWEEPERFNPDRFLQDETKSRHRLAYMPFGAGSRTCVANHFALVEGTLLLALIARQYDLKLASGYQVEPELTVTLRPRHGLLMTLHKR
jgi:cytochrome P450